MKGLGRVYRTYVVVTEIGEVCPESGIMIITKGQSFLTTRRAKSMILGRSRWGCAQKNWTNESVNGDLDCDDRCRVLGLPVRLSGR